MKKMKFFAFAAATAGFALLLLCGCNRQSGSESAMYGRMINSPVAGKRVAYVMRVSPSEIFYRQSDAAKRTAEALGMEYDGFFCGDSDTIWQNTVYQCAAAGYDGVMRSGQNIPLVSVDISNADIEKMAMPNSPWKACATTNWADNGEFGMRLLALQIANEYDKIVDPATGLPTDWIELPTIVVTQDMVSSGDITLENLASVIGPSYDKSSYMPTTDWMARLLGD